MRVFNLALLYTTYIHSVPVLKRSLFPRTSFPLFFMTESNTQVCRVLHRVHMAFDIYVQLSVAYLGALSY